VRNFGILKIKLDLPTRVDQYKDEPLEVNLTSNVTKIISGENSTKAKKLAAISKSRFIKITTLSKQTR
jgi:hypothetical protein